MVAAVTPARCKVHIRCACNTIKLPLRLVVSARRPPSAYSDSHCLPLHIPALIVSAHSYCTCATSPMSCGFPSMYVSLGLLCFECNFPLLLFSKLLVCYSPEHQLLYRTRPIPVTTQRLPNRLRTTSLSILSTLSTSSSWDESLILALYPSMVFNSLQPKCSLLLEQQPGMVFHVLGGKCWA